MIKLVSQFDDEKSRLSLATPTCIGACCSCCCCCIVSTVTTASLSSRNIGRLTEQQYPDDVEKIRKVKKAVLLFYILLPLVCLIPPLFIFNSVIYILVFGLLIIMKNKVKGLPIRMIRYYILLLGLAILEYAFVGLHVDKSRILFLSINSIEHILYLYVILAIPLSICIKKIILEEKFSSSGGKTDEMLKTISIVSIWMILIYYILLLTFYFPLFIFSASLIIMLIYLVFRPREPQNKKQVNEEKTVEEKYLESNIN